MKFLVANFYKASINHVVEADSEEEAIEKGRELDDDPKELRESLQYVETLCIEIEED